MEFVTHVEFLLVADYNKCTLCYSYFVNIGAIVAHSVFKVVAHIMAHIGISVSMLKQN